METVVVLRVAVVQDIDVVNSSETVKLQFYWGNINFQRAHVVSGYFQNTFFGTVYSFDYAVIY